MGLFDRTVTNMLTFPLTRISSWAVAAAAIVVLGAAAECSAQATRGGEFVIPAVATGEERTAQSDLYVMDVYCKPLRMIQVKLTDPATGEQKLEFVWYIVYRVFNRELTRPSYDTPPVNELDPEVKTSSLFVPAFTLITTDTKVPQIYEDVVLPEALPIIQKREKGKYLDTVNIVGPIPAAGEQDDADREGLWGVAMWRGIDPEADRYTVYMTGFSNGIRAAKGEDGEPVIRTKTIVQKFWRPGDAFDRAEPEIRIDGNAQWIYR